jgi:phosphomannomutase
LVSLYQELGARVLPLGFSDTFIPVDTEAIRDEDISLARKWAASHRLDAIVSTDGDSDRPLTFDETGHPIRGDVSGIITARFLGADAVATPVSCNTAVESSGAFTRVLRTKIGSPFVIEKMEQARRAGAKSVVGYEANGGFLTLSTLALEGGRELPALPTRDAVIVHLALLLSAKRGGKKLSELLRELPSRFTASGRDQTFSKVRSGKLLKRLANMDPAERRETFGLGPLLTIDTTDGMRFSFEAGDIVHLRPSGNAPELRCYAEASTEERARELVVIGLALANRLCPTTTATS